jgi:hypothetical protein
VRQPLNSPELGIEISSAFRHLCSEQFRQNAGLQQTRPVRVHCLLHE